MEHFVSQVGFFCAGAIFGAGVLYQKVNNLSTDIRELKDIINELPCKQFNCGVQGAANNG